MSTILKPGLLARDVRLALVLASHTFSRSCGAPTRNSQHDIDALTHVRKTLSGNRVLALQTAPQRNTQGRHDG
jgi:hypothetical protein